MSTARIRAAAWLVVLVGMAVSLFAMRIVLDGQVDRLQLALVLLPHTIGMPGDVVADRPARPLSSAASSSVVE